MMKIILFSSLFLSLLFFHAVKALTGKTTLFILYNSDTKSYIEGCGCKVNLGGAAPEGRSGE
jgi:hypothetical protein